MDLNENTVALAKLVTLSAQLMQTVHADIIDTMRNESDENMT